MKLGRVFALVPDCHVPDWRYGPGLQQGHRRQRVAHYRQRASSSRYKVACRSALPFQS